MVTISPLSLSELHRPREHAFTASISGQIQRVLIESSKTLDREL